MRAGSLAWSRRLAAGSREGVGFSRAIVAAREGRWAALDRLPRASSKSSEGALSWRFSFRDRPIAAVGRSYTDPQVLLAALLAMNKLQSSLVGIAACLPPKCHPYSQTRT